MPNTTTSFEKDLREHEKERRQTAGCFDKEAASIAVQAETAKGSAERARERLAELEAKHPALALAAVTSGAGEEHEALEDEMADERKALSLAELAGSEAERRAQELEEHRRRAEHEGHEARYDLYTKERRGRIEAVETAVGELITRLDALLELDEEHMRAYRDLTGQLPAGRPYSDMVDEYLAHRLMGYMSGGSFQRLAIGGKAIDSLLAVDLHTKPLEEQRAENEEQMRRVEEQIAAEKRARESYERRQAFANRRRQLRVNAGADAELPASRLAEIDARVDGALAREGYGDLIEEERHARLEKRKSELRATLGAGDDEPYETLSEERKAEVDRAVEEWLADEYPDGAA